MEAPKAYQFLADALLEDYGKRWRVSRRTLAAHLERGGFFQEASQLGLDQRADPAAVLAVCQGTMASLCPQTPQEGWLARCYAYLADGLFPDRDFIRPRHGEKLALELYLCTLGCLMEREPQRLPHSLLLDPCPVTTAELAKSRIREEYKRFTACLRESRYLLLLRLAPLVLPYDPAAHIIGVHNVAVAMARQAAQCGLPVDLPLVAASSLVHDIGKFGCRGQDAKRVPYLHYYYTWEWGARQGLPEIAHIAANHSTWDLEFQNLPLESLLLIYADFRVRGQREEGRERIHIYTLSEAHDIIFSKLANMTEEKRRQYEIVYQKLWDFQSFLQSQGVDPDPLGSLRPRQEMDASLLSPKAAEERLRSLAFYHNIQLMHTLSGQRSVEQLLEQARGEKDRHRMRTYLRLLEDYSVYMTRSGKLLALSFLYELLMHSEGDVRRHAGSIMGQILAGSGPQYRKELPSRAPKGAAAPSINEVLQEAADLWDSYIERCLHPDVKISTKHAQRISNSLKTITKSLFASCAPGEARHFLAPLASRFLGEDLRPGDPFILIDALLHAPLELLTPREAAGFFRRLCQLVAPAGQEERLVIYALRLGERLLESRGGEGTRGALALVRALPGEQPPAVAYLMGRLRARAGKPAQPPQTNVSDLFLANLKNAVHWTVKLTYIDMLEAYARENRQEAFHVAMHLSNLLSVSEHLPVRERAGQALRDMAELLRVDQRNEIVIDLIRELESGEDEISNYIPPYLGALICGLPPKETAECTTLLEAMVRSSNIRPARAALATLGVMLGQLEDPALTPRILGLLLTGIAHYEDSIHRTALYVLCRRYFDEPALPLEKRMQTFICCAKKLLTLLCEPREDSITFFNRAAMVNHLYRFITTAQAELGPCLFPPAGRAAFFPGTFDPFSAGHRRIVDEIRRLGFTVYLAVDEFSWNKRTLPKLLRRQIALMSVADAPDVFLFPDDLPVNIAIPADLKKLSDLFPGEGVWLVMGSDVVFNASAYYQDKPGGASYFNHIVFARVEGEEQEAARASIRAKIHGELIILSLPAYYETVSSTRIRQSIDKSMDISMLVDPVVQDFIYAKGLYLRSPQNKRVLTLESLYFDGGRQGDSALRFSLHSREADTPLGEIRARILSVPGLHEALGSAAEAEALRQRASGRILLIEGCSAIHAEAARLLCNQLLARSLADDVTYAVYRPKSPEEHLASLLPQLGFLSLPGAEGLLLVDMRSPLVLIQDVLSRIKEPLSSDAAVIRAVHRRRPSLRLGLCGLFPGRLLLTFDAELLNQALMAKVQKWNGVLDVPPGQRRLGPNMCVPYGKILSADIVPNTVTKALHAEKAFHPDLTGFSFTETPGYSSLRNQVRTLKSFQRPVLLVDDLLHNGYRMEKLDPIFKAEDVPIARIITGILSGRGLDLMRTQGRAVDCEYFIPNLGYWFNESLLYPFIGGDGIEGQPLLDTAIPSVNLMLPYAYPRFLHGAGERAVWELDRIALSNARDILQVLEERHGALLSGPLTLRRLGEAFIAPRIPYKGDGMRYDPNLPPSQYLDQDLDALERLDTLPPQQARGRGRP